MYLRLAWREIEYCVNDPVFFLRTQESHFTNSKVQWIRGKILNPGRLIQTPY